MEFAEIRRDKHVIVAGGGIAGLTAAMTLVKQGYQVDVYEKREVLGGKWSSWRDADGDWIETGLHVFFGAYDEIFTLMRELGVYERILWKEHVMTYTLSEGERFEFRTRRLPSPFHLLPAAFENRFFTWKEKLTLIRALYPMLFGSNAYFAAQDQHTYKEWNDSMGIDQRMFRKMFMPMTLALKFLSPEEISARIVLEVIGIFLRQNSASRIGFLRGSPQQHLIGPMVDFITRHGGCIHENSRIEQIELRPDGAEVAALHISYQAGDRQSPPQRMSADDFVLALPIHNLQKLIPAALQPNPYFAGLMKFNGVPVVTVHLWTDRQVSNLDNCLFSPDGFIPVYADMANTTPEYRRDPQAPMPQRGSRFQFVVAPAQDLIHLSDDAIVAKVWANVRDVFPETSRESRIVKSVVVRIPQSVYGPLPGLDQYRVPQASPIPNLFLAGGYTLQKFYDSMEGACRSGNRAAKALIARDLGLAWHPTP